MNNRVIVISDDDDDDAKLTVYTANNKDIVVIDDSEDDINLPPASSNKCPTRTSRGESSLKRKRNSAEDEECLQNIKRKKTEHNPSESDNFGCDFNIYEPSITFTACSTKDAAPNSTKTHCPDSHASTGQNTATKRPSTWSDEGQSSTSKDHRSIVPEQRCSGKKERMVFFNKTSDSKLVCPVCSQTSDYLDFLKHYIKSHVRYCRYCVKCNLCCYNGGNVHKHFRNPKHTFRCPFCVSESAEEWPFGELLQHFKSKHDEQYFNGETYVCPSRYCCTAVLKNVPHFVGHNLIKHHKALETVQAATRYCYLCDDKHVHFSEEKSLIHFMEEHRKVLTKEVYEVFEQSAYASMVAGIDKDKLPSSSDTKTIRMPSTSSVTNLRSTSNDQNNLPLAFSDKLNTQSSQNNKTDLKSSSTMSHLTTTNQSYATDTGKNVSTDLVSDSSLARNKEPKSRRSRARNRTKSAPSNTSKKRKRESSTCLLKNTSTTSKDGCSTQSNNSQAHSSHKRPRTTSAPSNVSNTSSFPPPSAASGSSRQAVSNIPNSPSVTLENLQKFSHIIFVDLDNWGRFLNLPYPLPSDVFVWGFCGGNYNKTSKAWSVNFRVLVREERFFQHPKCGKSKNAADFALCMQAARLDLQLPMHIPFTVLSGDKGFDELRNQLKSSARQIHLLNPHNEDQDMLHALLASIGQT